MTPEDAPGIVDALGSEPVARIQGDLEAPFFTRQKKIVLENCGRIDPERIEDYIAAGGYVALSHAHRDDADRRHPAGDAVGPARPRRRRLPDRAEVGHGRQGPGHAGSTSSATATKATPAPSWTAASWRAIRTASSKAWPSPATPSARARASSTSGPSTRSPSSASRRRSSRPSGLGLLGNQHLRHDVQLQRRDPPRRRRLRLRRGDGAHRLDRRQARHAAPAAALPRRIGPVGPPDAHQQRRDLRQHPADHPQRRRLVRRHRHRARARAPRSSRSPASQQHRPHRGAHGHHPARDHLRHRRRHPGRQEVQGRPDRRPLGRLHPGAVPRHAGRLRVARASSARSWAPAA